MNTSNKFSFYEKSKMYIVHHVQRYARVQVFTPFPKHITAIPTQSLFGNLTTCLGIKFCFDHIKQEQ